MASCLDESCTPLGTFPIFSCGLFYREPAAGGQQGDAGESYVARHRSLSGRACPASSAWWLLLPQSPLPPSLTHRTSGHRDLLLLVFHLQPSHPIGFLTFNQDLVLTSAFSHAQRNIPLWESCWLVTLQISILCPFALLSLRLTEELILAFLLTAFYHSLMPLFPLCYCS